jgi:O-succinylbenzoic acid--CoA ligase
MGKIIFNNRYYSFEKIRQGDWETSDPYLHQGLSFCQEWLRGQTFFDLHTSGSTGLPKSIKANRKQMEASAAATRSFFNIGSGSILLCCLNIQMIAGKMMLIRGMEWDSTIFLVPPTGNPLEGIACDFDFAAMVPIQVMTCLDDSKSLPKIQSIKNLIIGGAPSSPSLIQKIQKLQVNAFQTFGMTETVSHIALANISSMPLIYQCLPGVQIGVDKELRLWIKAPMSGNKKIQTNDIVELMDERQFQWLGRADFTINSGGIKLQPEQMENRMTDLMKEVYGHSNFFLFGKPDEKLGQKLALLIEEKDADPKKEQKLVYGLEQLLDRYHLPKEIYYVGKFHKTASGKVNRPETIKKII